MNPPRLKLPTLLGGIAFLACACAALRLASDVWAGIIATVTFLLLMTGLAGAGVAKGLERAFWGGFALFGITSGVLICWNWTWEKFGDALTSPLVRVALIVFPEPPVPASASVVVSASAYVPKDPRSIWEAHVNNFVQIGCHCLTLGFALIGGLITRGLAARAATPRSDS